MIYPKQQMCTYLRFMRECVPGKRMEEWSIEDWKYARRYWINYLCKAMKLELEAYADEPDEQPLRYTYSAFALLSLLVSERFLTLLLKVLCAVECDYLDFGVISLAFAEMERGFAAEPVRETQDWERRVWAEQKGIIPKRFMPEEQEKNQFDFSLRHHVAFDRIQLSIDPYTPVEVAVKKMRELLEKKQAEYLQEIREDEERHIHAFRAGWKEHGITTDDEEEYINQVVERERRRFDFVRRFEGNKRVRGETIFSTWLRALRIYDLMQNKGYSWRETAFRIGGFAHPDRENTRRTIYRFKNRAKQLIDAAWAGVPLAAVKFE